MRPDRGNCGDGRNQLCQRAPQTHYPEPLASSEPRSSLETALSAAVVETVQNGMLPGLARRELHTSTDLCRGLLSSAPRGAEKKCHRSTSPGVLGLLHL